MAKSVRASVSKRNRANLRKKVFGPVVDARTERLAAKLQELASQPTPEHPEKATMELEVDETGMCAQDALLKRRQPESLSNYLFLQPRKPPPPTRVSLLPSGLLMLLFIGLIERSTNCDTAMDIDTKSTKTSSSKSGRVQKQHRNRRTRPSIVFQKPGSKNKKGGPKKK